MPLDLCRILVEQQNPILHKTIKIYTDYWEFEVIKYFRPNI